MRIFKNSKKVPHYAAPGPGLPAPGSRARAPDPRPPAPRPRPRAPGPAHPAAGPGPPAAGPPAPRTRPPAPRTRPPAPRRTQELHIWVTAGGRPGRGGPGPGARSRGRAEGRWPGPLLQVFLISFFDLGLVVTRRGSCRHYYVALSALREHGTVRFSRPEQHEKSSLGKHILVPRPGSGAGARAPGLAAQGPRANDMSSRQMH